MIVRASAADALVHVPRGEDALAAGQPDPLPLALAQRGPTVSTAHGTGRVPRPRRARPSCVATAAQTIRTSTVGHGMNPSVISETT